MSERPKVCHVLKLFKSWYYRHFSEPGTIEFALVLVALFLIIYYLMWLVGPLVIALCLAYVLDWAVIALMKKGLSRHLASIVVMLGFVGAMVLTCIVVVPQIVRQGAQFYDAMVALSQDVVSDHPLAEGTVQSRDLDSIIAMRVRDVVDELPEPLPTMVSEESLIHMVRQVRTQVTVYVVNVMRTQLMPSVVNVVTYLMYLIIVPIFTFLMLYSKRELQRRVRLYLLPNNQALMQRFWPSMSRQIEGYIRGKLLHIIIITVVNSLAFRAFDLNYALLLGFGVGVSVLIPYVGTVLIAIPVILVALFQFGASMTLFWLLLLYLVIQLLDSKVLTPMIFSKAMNLDAFSILAAILIFGGLWGFWGVVLSIPAATLIKTLIMGWPTVDEKAEALPKPAPR